MDDKPSRLGRGLAALIGDMAQNEGKRVAESLQLDQALAGRFRHRQPRTIRGATSTPTSSRS